MSKNKDGIATQSVYSLVRDVKHSPGWPQPTLQAYLVMYSNVVLLTQKGGDWTVKLLLVLKEMRPH